MEKEIVMIHNEQDLRSKIYTIRGLQVMLDFDLAEIYGYSVKAFNQQVKNNIEKFDNDFRFQLNAYEVLELSRSKILTSIQVKGVKGGRAYLPYAFTEQGIYMLMTVLRGDLAIRQSKMLVRLFKEMKDFIIEREHFIGYDEVAKLAIKTALNTENIAEHSKDIAEIRREIKENVATKADIAQIIEDFSNTEIKKDFLFLNGRSVEADLAYQEIYSQAKKTIFVIDNYIGLKTLVLLKSVPENVKITIFTDNLKKGLHQKEYDDFCKEYPNVVISFKRTNGIFHDRYIIIDFGTENEIIYHCGASSKDAGSRVCSITTIADNEIYKQMIENLLKNRELIL
ncbi:ORF6N domain-containing protein [bacterium]|nr:ORF6N domain-containing protein [bacterium]